MPIVKIWRTASLADLKRLDAEDLRQTTMEERISAVESLRARSAAGDRPAPRLERVLACVDLATHALSSDRGPRSRRARRAPNTEDLDVFVEPTLANARRLRTALVDFGFGAVAPPPAELAQPDKVFMLGRKPLRIDILTGIDGVSFARAWKGRVSLPFEEGRLHVIGRAELIANKRAAGRLKDRLDLELLGRYRPRPPRSRKS